MTLQQQDIATEAEKVSRFSTAQTDSDPAIPTGPAAAAVLAAGIGCAALGILIVLAQGIAWVKSILTFNGPVGPLSGKTIVACAIWLIAWAALHFLWRAKDVRFGTIWMIALILIALGLIGSFPPVFELVGH